jgi:Cu+-exporting ATPase
VKARRDEGWQLVVVVSAMGDTTDELLQLAKKISADPPRRESVAAVRQLRQRGLDVLMLSGDAARTAQTIAEATGIGGYQGDIRPEQKAELIRQRQRRGEVIAMVGDGINDAPALALADIGIALGSGSDVAMETAGVTLMRPDPRLVAAALDVSAATWRKLQQNLFWAFIYNLIGIPLAASGNLDPAIAGAAMALSSISVVSNSLLLRRWRPKLDDRR